MPRRPGKGVDEYAVEVLTSELLHSGHAGVTLKSDQEPSILALKAAAAARAKLQGVAVFMEEAPAYDSRSNGLAEAAVREAKNQIRTLVAASAGHYGQDLGGDSVLMPWLVAYAGSVLNRARVGIDGKTAYELRKGRRHQRTLPIFGERVFYQILGATGAFRWH